MYCERLIFIGNGRNDLLFFRHNRHLRRLFGLAYVLARPRLLLTKLLNYHIVDLSLLNFQTCLATPMASIGALTLPSKYKYNIKNMSHDY